MNQSPCINNDWQIGALTSSHNDTAHDHQLPVMTTEETKQPEYDNSTREDCEPDWQTSDPNAYWIVAVYVESLRGPEQEHREEVGARNACDDQRKDEDTWALLYACWEHGVWGEFCLPDDKGDEEEEADKERYEDVGGFPAVLHTR